MATDLTNVKVGDRLSMRLYSNWERYPISHRILVVERLTATQVVCIGTLSSHTEWRFNRKTGRQIGSTSSLDVAVIATPDLIAENHRQLAEFRRGRQAEGDLVDLFGKHAHQLKLSLEQTEALAKAWKEIKAMHKQPLDEASAAAISTKGE